jgi:hypothetical protein
MIIKVNYRLTFKFKLAVIKINFKKVYAISLTNSLSCINTYGLDGIAPGPVNCTSDQIFCKVNLKKMKYFPRVIIFI